MGFSEFFDYSGGGVSEEEELEFLRGFTEAQWEQLLTHTQTERFATGEVVLAIGSRERALFIVVEGSLEVLAGRPGGRKPQRVALIEEGSIVGEQTFLDGKERSAEVRARSEVRVLRLTLDAFERFAAQHPDLARQLLFDLGRILSIRLRRTTALLVARR